MIAFSLRFLNYLKDTWCVVGVKKGGNEGKKKLFYVLSLNAQSLGPSSCREYETEIK